MYSACTAGALLVRAIGAVRPIQHANGQLRAAGDTYFESRVPHGVRWAADDGTAIELSSDQLFQMMFMVGNLTPSHALMVLLFTGVIAHDTPLAASTKAEDGPAEGARQVVHAGAAGCGCRAARGISYGAVAVAVRLDTEVLIDS